MNDCRFGVSPVNYPDPDPDLRHDFTRMADKADGSAVLAQLQVAFL